MQSIASIVVTYNPNASTLKKNILSLSAQTNVVYIIDNTPNGYSFPAEVVEQSNVEIITLGTNKGIAEAQNIGLKKCLKNNYRYCLLADQDTHFPNNYVEEMLANAPKESWSGIAPRFRDGNRVNHEEGFILFNGFIERKIYPKEPTKITQAIASGMIIQLNELQCIGLFRSDLFIDWVDLEWCWRANSSASGIFGIPNVHINHVLGDKNVTFLGKQIPVRNHIRHYYITRNAIYLARYDEHINFKMRVNLAFKTIMYMIIFPIVSEKKVKNLSWVIRGFLDGFNAKLGEVEQ